MLLFTVVYGILSVITWSAFVYKVRDLLRDRHNRELQLLCLAIANFAAPFVLASPAVYVGIDRILGVPNIATLIIYTCVAVCLTSFVALLVSWSSAAQHQVRLRHRLLVGYSVTTLVVMAVFFFLGNVSGEEHPLDFDVHFEHVRYISVFLLSYQLLFTVSMAGLITLCWRYARAVDGPWLRRGLRFVTVGAVFGEGYAVPKVVNMLWDLFGPSPLHYVSSVVAPMSASVSAALFAVGFTMPAWGAGVSRGREFAATYRAYRRLYPLWHAIAEQFPEIVLFPPTPRTARRGAGELRRLVGRQVIEIRDGRLALRPHDDPELGHTARDMELLVSRQTVEIRDGQLALRPHYEPALASAARELARSKGLTGDRAEAVVEAARIAGALRARAAGEAPPESPGPAPHDPADGDPQAEVVWLIQVADAYRGSPLVRAALAADRPRADQVDA
ncbi:hypothetical protein OG455_39670 [Kitasatospora sp. NBC_01287]|uniref:MAB_1171c family putative transporter n=1 Tax=Kitasatospora sp. NBC_01287 TaxID=2903573 RepID=UPI00224CD871|nr:MAB_1171c family putative transporter [Kitasatospora sp. NBC_01287]MCX4751555.1 hypothetical protein [Kitasatospora sp. NBC_01287]